MKVVLIGVGQAGGKVAQSIVEFDYEMGFEAVQDAFAVNTAASDLQALDLDSMLIGQDRVKGHGVGGDNELGAEIMQEEATEVLDQLGERIHSEVEAVVIVAGLGGGTGSGGAPALSKELRRIYDIPIYVLGILPGRDEGSIYQTNAGRSLKTVARESDATLLIDNDAWRESGESVEEGSASASCSRRVRSSTGSQKVSSTPQRSSTRSGAAGSQVSATRRPKRAWTLARTSTRSRASREALF
jgi:cell division GTPase FtsZ